MNLLLFSIKLDKNKTLKVLINVLKPDTKDKKTKEVFEKNGNFFKKAQKNTEILEKNIKI